MFIQYESISEFLADRKSKGTLSKFHGNFYSQYSDSEMERRMVAGDESLVPEAEKFLEKIEAQFPETLNKELRPYVYGPVLSVPDYLSGTPTPFRRQTDVESTTAPVKICVAITSSGNVGSAQLKVRGLAISALLMKLQSVRPVDLIVYTESEGSIAERFNNNQGIRHGATPGIGRLILAMKMESRPLAIAHVLNVLSDSNVARNLFYTLGGHYMNKGRNIQIWPEDWRTPGYDKWVAQQFQLEEQDIIVPSTFTSDSILRDPIGWINENLTKLGYTAE